MNHGFCMVVGEAHCYTCNSGFYFLFSWRPDTTRLSPLSTCRLGSSTHPCLPATCSPCTHGTMLVVCDDQIQCASCRASLVLQLLPVGLCPTVVAPHTTVFESNLPTLAVPIWWCAVQAAKYLPMRDLTHYACLCTHAPTRAGAAERDGGCPSAASEVRSRICRASRPTENRLKENRAHSKVTAPPTHTHAAAFYLVLCSSAPRTQKPRDVSGLRTQGVRGRRRRQHLMCQTTCATRLTQTSALVWKCATWTKRGRHPSQVLLGSVSAHSSLYLPALACVCASITFTLNASAIVRLCKPSTAHSITVLVSPRTIAALRTLARAGGWAHAANQSRERRWQRCDPS